MKNIMRPCGRKYQVKLRKNTGYYEVLPKHGHVERLDHLVTLGNQCLFLYRQIFRKFINNDFDKDERLNVTELVKFLRNLYLPNNRNVYDILKVADDDQDDYITYREIMYFAETLATTRHDTTWEIFYSIPKTTTDTETQIYAPTVQKFFHDVQKEDITLEHAADLVAKFHKRDGIADYIREEHFEQILLSYNTDPIDKKNYEVFQNMSLPLTDYYIFTSHNTYLTGRQQDGPVGSWNYRKALELGVRVLQIDTMDTWSGVPKVTQYDSLTNGLNLDDVLFTISKFAFTFSNYPLILDIRNYCNIKQSEYFYSRIRQVFGSYLVEQSLHGKMDELPSPFELTNRILLKGDAGPFTVYMDNRELVQLSAGISFSELFAVAYQESRTIDSSTITDEIATILRYSNSRGVGAHTAFQMLKIEPSNWRLASNNFDPIYYWNLGVHMIAANIQYEDWPLYSHITFFRGNGNSGYVRKPRFIEFQGFDPLTDEIDRMYSTPIRLRIEIRYGELFQNKGKAFNRRIDPFVRISVYGLPVDTKYLETAPVENDGYNPEWTVDNKMEFVINYPELAWLLIELVDAGLGDTDWEHNEGVYSLPVLNLAQGWRYVHLESYGGFRTGSAAIFMHVSIDSLAPDRVQPNEAERRGYTTDQFQLNQLRIDARNRYFNRCASC